ncbi:MAG: XTP/dITP diphosphohydrolase [Candidatus Tokpelaia sp. JSC161]|jgi:XTP/dITP diphosphohydrolase|nr:MAG: XTP/dITP diphosphohydrolase [Candidatus Tokpelaia sp. JSC161]
MDMSIRKLVIATHNKGKLKEIADLLTFYKIEILTAQQLGLPTPKETGVSFEENAYIKALTATQAIKLPIIADDSGLTIDALNGAPGIYTSDWAKQENGKSKFWKAMQTIENTLQKVGAINIDQRSCRFISVICHIRPNGCVQYFRGEIKGKIIWPPRGCKGFAFDPIFQPEGYQKTFGEMTYHEKNLISHRTLAFKKFAEAVLEKK